MGLLPYCKSCFFSVISGGFWHILTLKKHLLYPGVFLCCKVSGCKIKEYCEAHDIQMYVIKNTVLSMSGIKNIAFKF